MGLIVVSNFIKMFGSEGGLARMVPPKADFEPEKIEEQNEFVIFVGAGKNLFAQGQLVKLSDINVLVKKFLLESADKTEIDLPLIGIQKTTRGIIYLKNDPGASYDFYISVQNELVEVYNELRNRYALQFFNTEFENLDQDKQAVIRKLVPQRIDESEP